MAEAIYTHAALSEAFRYGMLIGRTGRDPHTSGSSTATKDDVERATDKIMSAISEYGAKQKAFNERILASLGTLGTSFDGVVGDIKSLNDKIEVLQNSPGQVTPEDAATINELEAAGDDLATKTEKFASALETLNQQINSAPVPPVA